MTTTTTIGTAKLDAIARGLKAHGTGRKNVARLAALFGVTEESVSDAIALANAPYSEGAVTESAAPDGARAPVNPVTLDRAQRFQREVQAAQAKPITSTTTQDLEALTAALYG